MRGHDAPSHRKSNPALALPSANYLSADLARELEVDAAEVTSKCNYVESIYGAGEVDCGPAPAEGRDFLITMQVFRSPEPHCLLGIPEHGGQFLGIVADQSGLILRVQNGEFGDDFGIVDDHG